jgi:hypothetical protein
MDHYADRPMDLALGAAGGSNESSGSTSSPTNLSGSSMAYAGDPAMDPLAEVRRNHHWQALAFEDGSLVTEGMSNLHLEGEER